MYCGGDVARNCFIVYIPGFGLAWAHSCQFRYAPGVGVAAKRAMGELTDVSHGERNVTLSPGYNGNAA